MPFPGSRGAAEPPPIDFDPVALRHRIDGWTPAKQRRFIEILADTGSVDDAALLVGMSRESAYRLRRRTDATGFAHAWEAAIHTSTRRLIDIAFDRAVNGVATPIFYKGERIGERRAYSDRLLIFLLKHYAPHQFESVGKRSLGNTVRWHARRLPLMLNSLLKRGRRW